MLRRVNRILGILLILTIPGVECHGQITPATASSNQRSVDLNRVLSWLPIDTETLLVSNGPFGMSNFLTGEDESKNNRETSENLEKEFDRWTLFLFNGKDSLLEKYLEGKKVLIAVEGSRHFRPPKGLGMMPFEGCEIAVFNDDLRDQPNSFFKDAASRASRIEEIEGQKVAVFQERSEQDTLTTYITFPQTNVVVVATDEQFLRQTLTRMQDVNSNAEKALPDSLPEWKYVDRSKRFWGLRHYDRQQAKEDPSSPYGGRKSANIPDEGAIGLTFDFEPGKANVARIVYLSSTKTDLDEIERKRFPSDSDEAIPGLHIQRAKIAPGVMRSTYNLNYSQPLSIFLFVLLGAMGHAIYL